MGNINVDPELVYAAYDQKLAAANKENVLLSGAVSQLQTQLTQVEAEKEVLESENKRLSENQKGDLVEATPAKS